MQWFWAFRMPILETIFHSKWGKQTLKTAFQVAKSVNHAASWRFFALLKRL